MAGPSDITDPEKIDPITGNKGPNSPKYEPDADAFKQHMDKTEANPLQNQKAPSPMDIARANKIAPSSPPTMNSVTEQMNSVSSSLGDIKTQLHTKGLKLKNSENHLLRTKLGNANEHINIAGNKLGIRPSPNPRAMNKSKNPITRFLAMVSDGQRQMVDAADTIKNLNASGQAVNPGDLLLVQIKLNKAQQELNYTSVILGNATSMVKTLFNIQI